MAGDVLISHRVQVLEETVKKHGERVHVLELAHARMLGYCAGAAFAGSLAGFLLQWLIQR